MALFEAMASSCPVVVSAHVDFAGTIQEADAGVVVAPDAISFADAVGQLLGDAALRRRMAQNARRLVEGRFRIQDAARELSERYKEILSGNLRSDAWKAAADPAEFNRRE
jgi:glycosyltransferase involved in cell wall biosynthesis